MGTTTVDEGSFGVPLKGLYGVLEGYYKGLGGLGFIGFRV